MVNNRLTDEPRGRISRRLISPRAQLSGGAGDASQAVGADAGCRAWIHAIGPASMRSRDYDDAGEVADSGLKVRRVPPRRSDQEVGVRCMEQRCRMGRVARLQSEV